jgi:preprotein translocase subunit SecA
MRADDVSETVADMRTEVISALVAAHIPEKAFAEQWRSAELAEAVQRILNLTLPVQDWAREEGIEEAQIEERIQRASDQYMAAKAANLGPELMRYVEKSMLLQILDQVWKEHLLALDHLRQGIGLRAYGQRDPLNEYKSEAFALFNGLLDELKERVTTMLARVELGPEPAAQAPAPSRTIESHPEPEGFGLESTGPSGYGMADTTVMSRSAAVDPNDTSTWASTPRNAACPCGSGKKFKHCHGRTM